MKVWYDTEFHERGPKYPIDFISIGMVREDGQELYLINVDADYNAAYDHEWLRNNVLRHLPGGVDFSGVWEVDRNDARVMLRNHIAKRISDFLRVPKVELWAWYGSYDHVVLAQTFGTMLDLPEHIPMWTNDLRQVVHQLGNPVLPMQAEGEHDALQDARFLRYRHEWLKSNGWQVP